MVAISSSCLSTYSFSSFVLSSGNFLPLLALNLRAQSIVIKSGSVMTERKESGLSPLRVSLQHLSRRVTNRSPDGRQKSTWPTRYVDAEPLDYGAFGSVVSVMDTKHNRKVAIKKQYTNYTVLDRKGKPVLALRAYRELLFLWCFRGHSNIVRLLDAFTLDSDASMAMLCTVTDIMDMDLEKVLEDGRIASEQMRVQISYGILCAIQDLKPKHIGISLDSQNQITGVKLLDFGLARKLRVEMSYVVQTVWYRAPEVWLQPGRYKAAIDIWSVGSILAEMIHGKALMRGGTGAGMQLQTIATYLEPPTSGFVNSTDPSVRSSVLCESSSRVVQQSPVKGRKIGSIVFEWIRYHQMLTTFKDVKRVPLKQALPEAGEAELDLLQRIFLWNPDERWGAEQCLNHQYFRKVNRNPYSRKDFPKVEAPEQDFEDWDNECLEDWMEWIEYKIQDIKTKLSSDVRELDH